MYINEWMNNHSLKVFSFAWIADYCFNFSSISYLTYPNLHSVLLLSVESILFLAPNPIQKVNLCLMWKRVISDFLDLPAPFVQKLQNLKLSELTNNIWVCQLSGELAFQILTYHNLAKLCIEICWKCWKKTVLFTDKSLSEALIFASTNPQYDNRLFIELQLQYMKIPSSEHGKNMLCTEIVFDIQNNFMKF